MRFLLDNMVSVRVKKLLRSLGHDALTARDLDLQQVKNGELYVAADRRGMMLLTYDSDYGSMQIGEKNGVSIIHVTIHPNTDKHVLPLIEEFIDQFDIGKTKGHIITLDQMGWTYKMY